ncbi:MAG: metallophosphoesterase [Desulfonatronovibrio sp.]
MLFFLAFFSIYLTMHVFTWFMFSCQFSLNRNRAASGYIVCLFAAASPAVAHLLPLSWPQQAVYFFWQFTFTWLAVIFYLFLFQLVVLAVKLMLWPFIKHVWPKISFAVGGLVILCSGLIVIYGFYEASRPVQVTGYKFETSEVPEDVRLVFLSELHLGVQNSCRRLERLIELIDEQEADLVVFGGDVFNDHLEWMEDEAVQLEKLSAPLGKFAVLGNHEFYAGLEESLDLFRQAGITIIDDEHIYLDELNLVLTGVTDPARHASPRDHQERVVRRLVRDIVPGKFNTLVSHRPWGFDYAAQSGVDLQLAGHTHNGQIFPFRYFVKTQFQYVYGLYASKESSLVVTSGAGSWGPPIRVLAPAEITVIDIVATHK